MPYVYPGIAEKMIHFQFIDVVSDINIAVRLVVGD
jgi:hypothetical protein